MVLRSVGVLSCTLALSGVASVSALSAPLPIPSCPNRPNASCPNILFLIDESTDGRTYREGFAPALPLPNIRALAALPGSVQFDTHYCNAPVCCPSRASIWSGRQPHKIPHQQAKNENLTVDGVWNNYEGLPSGYSDKINDVLTRRGYDTTLSGKEDWTTGAHSLNVELNSWTMYVQFPYSVNQTGGWYDESICTDTGTINDNDTYYRASDWKAVNSTTDWIRKMSAVQLSHRANGTAPRPWFAYQGMNIVHPSYATNTFWHDKIDMDKVTVPAWEPLKDLHPCDFQESMLKKCTPSDADAAAFYDPERRKRVRSVYYAMITEFDAMVGAYIATVQASGVSDNTVIIVTSDHGDMDMEHQQFYKMVQYDASSRVPLIIHTPWGTTVDQALITAPTQHVDLFPTIVEFAGVPQDDWPDVLDGESLVPFLTPNGTPEHSGFAVSQFHGSNIAMSWFLAMDGQYKLVVFGTGEEVEAQLFDITADIDETHNLAKSKPDIVAALDAKLRSIIDYPAVASDVAAYNMASFKAWQDRTPDWKTQVATGRWADPFAADSVKSLAAIEEWLSEKPTVKACRGNLTWDE